MNVALTSFLCDIEGSQSVGVLIGFFFGLGRSWYVEECVGAPRLGVLACWRSSTSWCLPPNLRRSFRFGKPWFRTISSSGLPVQLLLLPSVPNWSSTGYSGTLRPRSWSSTRSGSCFYRGSERLHTRGSRCTYRLGTFRTSVRSHGRDDTEAGWGTPAVLVAWIMSLEHFLNVTNL